MIRIGVFGKQPLVRSGIRRILEKNARASIVEAPSPDMIPAATLHGLHSLVVCAETAEAALCTVRQMKQPPGRSAASAIVVLSRLTSDDVPVLLREGVLGLFLDTDVERHLSWAVDATVSGSLALSPVVADSVIGQYVRHLRRNEQDADSCAQLRRLSPRHRDILALIAEGLSNLDIAEKLSISTHTVKDHVRTIYARLDVDNRIQAARIAWQAERSPLSRTALLQPSS
ncbi:response regulator transcription factor [Streptomyces sp. NPDC052225]|uniref:response regulator transcription factor n=1 Tax=Streptomyces sp. NPDC052225 TaxID=3154949 RepID=UPI0034376EA5